MVIMIVLIVYLILMILLIVVLSYCFVIVCGSRCLVSRFIIRRFVIVGIYLFLVMMLFVRGIIVLV